eukprot:CAMPEP_0170139274 /NCGR_PEP_ID=MMETSP0033_2-20121228/5515_1 /TAXON_ID=195969 /ORGANISM="Dolichomastix tenuilepis, Strain CCMP3274" /LENGTH=339 /DNA_ID=CAMNT_0010375373 /DNA_START=44 /DNA_END=1063 /DNA_ORIENTATION=+
MQTISAKGLAAPLTRPAAAARGRGAVVAWAPRAPVRGTTVSLCTTQEAAGASCSIDNMAGCSLADLEMMYIDALWSYHTEGGPFKLTDEQYDRLKDELNWQGSGFPTLKRYEVQFIEASIAYARGTPVVTDDEYEKLKTQVKAGGKRQDVTALLLYTKGQQLLDPEQYENLAEEMTKLGIEVGMKGTSCTLTEVPETLTNDLGTLALMNAGLSAIPTTLFGLLPYAALTLFTDLSIPPAAGLLGAVTIGAAVTTQLKNYLNLNDAEVLKGQCPCCESEVKQFFSGNDKSDSAQLKCGVCATTINIMRTERRLELVEGPSFVPKTWEFEKWLKEEDMAPR